jgi:hypothetical protein
MFCYWVEEVWGRFEQQGIPFSSPLLFGAFFHGTWQEMFTRAGL